MLGKENKFSIPHSNEWLRPDIAYAKYQAQAKGLDLEVIEYDGKYKRIRELRDLAVFGLAYSAMQEFQCFVQMNDIEASPDAFLMRHISQETNEIAPIELTVYARNKIGLPGKTLLEKLTEKKGKFNKLPNDYFLLIHIGKDLVTDYEAIAKKLSEMSAKFMFSLSRKYRISQIL